MASAIAGVPASNLQAMCGQHAGGWLVSLEACFSTHDHLTTHSSSGAYVRW